MNGVTELRPCGSGSWGGTGHSLELLILWDVPCSVCQLLPWVSRDKGHNSSTRSRLSCPLCGPATAAPKTSGQLPPYSPLQLYPAGFSTGKRLLGKGLKGFSVISTPVTSSQIVFYQSTLLHTMDPSPSLSAFPDGAGAGQPPSASLPAQPQTSITSTHLFVELQLRDSFIDLIHAIVFKEQKSWKEKQKNQKNVSHYG